jgi:hypothetical protein
LASSALASKLQRPFYHSFKAKICAIMSKIENFALLSRNLRKIKREKKDFLRQLQKQKRPAFYRKTGQRRGKFFQIGPLKLLTIMAEYSIFL